MAEASSTHDAFKTLKVLIVEDDSFAQRAIARVLRTVGVDNVVTADNGADAMALLGKAETEVNLVLCDIMMPEMDGYEFVRRIRYGTLPDYKDLPIIMLTAHDSEKNVRLARIHRIDGFIVKPPKPIALAAHFRRILGLEGGTEDDSV